jgi:hypothetical protein
MEAREQSRIHREFRIMRRAVRRGERTQAELDAFVAQHPTVFGTDRKFEPMIDSPFRSRDGKSIHLESLYAGSPLFLVLSGPSIKLLNLESLNRRGVVTMGVNNSPAIHRPHLWTFVDPPHKFHDGIWRDPAVLKFVPTRMWRRPIRTRNEGRFEFIHRRIDGANTLVQCGDMPGVIGYERNSYFEPRKWLAESTINWGNSMRSSRTNRNHRCLNTMFAALKIAYAVGFRIVYLLGCDFKMSAETPYAFAQSSDEGKAASNNNGYAVMQSMFGELKPHFAAAGFSVFNCTPESGLTVFPYVSYHDAINAATASVPQDPLDTARWYDPINGGNPEPVAGASHEERQRSG